MIEITSKDKLKDLVNELLDEGYKSREILNWGREAIDDWRLKQRTEKETSNEKDSN